MRINKQQEIALSLVTLAASLVCAQPSAAPIVDPNSLRSVYNPFPVSPRFTPVAVPGSMMMITGQNLAPDLSQAATTPLPTELLGTSITVYGVSAPLFSVSPNLIVFQYPTLPFHLSAPLTVTTQGGSTTITSLPSAFSGGLASADGSACGPALAWNVNADGDLEPNDASHAVAPGGRVIVQGSGLGFIDRENPYQVPLPDGLPTPDSPAYVLRIGDGYEGPQMYGLPPIFTLNKGVNRPITVWKMYRTPGLIGVDWLDFQVPYNAPEGCAIPISMSYVFPYTASNQVTLSIRKGRGPCTDSIDTLALAEWRRIISTGYKNPPPTDSLHFEWTSAVANRFPLGPLVGRNAGCACHNEADPPPQTQCPLPDQLVKKSWAPTAFQGVPGSPLDDQGNPIPDIRLPDGWVVPGPISLTTNGLNSGYSLSSTGSIIAVPIELTSAPSPSDPKLSVTWKGGDPNHLVRFTIIGKYPGRKYICECTISAFFGKYQFSADANVMSPTSDVEMIVHYGAEGDQVNTYFMAKDADGNDVLSLGGRVSWAFEWRFAGLSVDTGKPGTGMETGEPALPATRVPRRTQ